MEAGAAIPLEVLRRAAEWAAILDGGAGAAEQAACEAWCREDPRHRLVLSRMRALDASLAGLDAAQRKVLRNAAPATAARRNRRRVALSVLLVAGAATLFWMPRSGEGPVQQLATARGEQRTLQLADQSTLLVDADSALDMRIDGRQRRIRLRQGRILATVAADPDRPFEVATADATATALGTAYIVDASPRGTRVTVVESTVQVCGRDDRQCIVLSAGETVQVRAGRAGASGRVDVQAAQAWTQGWLEADDLRLDMALEELARHLQRPLRFDAAALGQLRITGSYPLHRAEESLRAMALGAGLEVEEEAGALQLRPVR